MNRFTDQMGRGLELSQRPKRIVSLVPSQTELLYDLGLSDEVVGITKFCIHPTEWFRTKPRIGGTKNVNLEKLAALEPDLIIANKEENKQADVEALSKNFPVWVSDINNLEDALQMIGGIGAITGKECDANVLRQNIKIAFENYKPPATNYKLKTAYLIWKKPYMTVGGDTFINDMLQQAGFTNVFSSSKRYPQITIPDLQAVDCQLLLLSSEPYPFKQADIDELQSELPHTRILLVDGEMFSWYGSRLLHTPAYFQSLRQQTAAMP